MASNPRRHRSQARPGRPHEDTVRSTLRHPKASPAPPAYASVLAGSHRWDPTCRRGAARISCGPAGTVLVTQAPRATSGARWHQRGRTRTFGPTRSQLAAARGRRRPLRPRQQSHEPRHAHPAPRRPRTLRHDCRNSDHGNRVDAAIAKLDTPSAMIGGICSIGTVSGTSVATPEVVVHKYGRTTGYTLGVIDDPSRPSSPPRALAPCRPPADRFLGIRAGIIAQDSRAEEQIHGRSPGVIVTSPGRSRSATWRRPWALAGPPSTAGRWVDEPPRLPMSRPRGRFSAGQRGRRRPPREPGAP